jgi:hypothetical protein
MSTKLSIEEKVYEKILSLQANDQFMADVLNLREKNNQLEEVSIVFLSIASFSSFEFWTHAFNGKTWPFAL